MLVLVFEDTYQKIRVNLWLKIIGHLSRRAPAPFRRCCAAAFASVPAVTSVAASRQSAAFFSFIFQMAAFSRKPLRRAAVTPLHRPNHPITRFLPRPLLCEC